MFWTYRIKVTEFELILMLKARKQRQSDWMKLKTIEE
jgi:hypothetical protein